MSERPIDPEREAAEAADRLRAQEAKWPLVRTLAQWIAGVREENHFSERIWGPAKGS